ncbi:MAG: twin-arginine translocation signal domain-containing protein [Afipia felis]|uniref:Multicopper oxidase n=2 Tax=Afipia felis TaxID=1035 RepID=A0A090MP85_AFIFE|nr:twin-arginine translocation signal domain-containing protein [Afipia felis]RTL65029.1 MAG: twin-arginine translocation signal domain-containing protein [Pseudonocardiaceae bacterium]EKS28355.1 tat (twin-arginine translocation) pathway signal sequence [Afipia felis ATCC 53690]MBN9602422.1 twin-arginine translocation signal domain-containing protein [Afipia felis]CEG09200.1 multicopper oxidase [Afipia felis]SUU77064.1 multicopper oxidase [Afipia felis]
MAQMTRRDFLAGTAAIGVAAGAGLCLQRLEATEPNPLRIPELIDARQQANGITLKAQEGRTSFFTGRGSAMNTIGLEGGSK